MLRALAIRDFVIVERVELVTGADFTVLTGRVITASNIFMFLASFAFQWGVGVLLRRWPADQGRYPAEAYAVAFGIVGALQLAALLWLLPMREKSG